MDEVNAVELMEWAKRFALEVLRLVGALAGTPVPKHLDGQLMRSGTSVAANHSGACRTPSRSNFVAKPGIVEEEWGESIFNSLQSLLQFSSIRNPKSAIRNETIRNGITLPRA